MLLIAIVFVIIYYLVIFIGAYPDEIFDWIDDKLAGTKKGRGGSKDKRDNYFNNIEEKHNQMLGRSPHLIKNEAYRDSRPQRVYVQGHTRIFNRHLPKITKDNNSDNNVKIGRAYELYIGYILEGEKYSVDYYGIEQKSNDLGRDLIAYKGDKILIIQCKCWAKESRIHENIICQLYGTTVEYKTREKAFDKKIIPVLYTTTSLTQTAQEFAEHLDVKVIKEPMNWMFYKNK